MMMIKKKSMIFILITILGFPQIALAESLIKVNTLVNDNNSLEKNEDNLLLTQRGRRRGGRRSRARRSRRGIQRAYRRRGYRRGRRREFRNEVRDYRRRERIRDVVGGMAAIGIGAAIAESNRNDGTGTQTIINNQGASLQERQYYDDLYNCQHLDHGGYYDSCR
jgi:hypothetical protein